MAPRLFGRALMKGRGGARARPWGFSSGRGHRHLSGEASESRKSVSALHRGGSFRLVNGSKPRYRTRARAHAGRGARCSGAGRGRPGHTDGFLRAPPPPRRRERRRARATSKTGAAAPAAAGLRTQWPRAVAGDGAGEAWGGRRRTFCPSSPARLSQTAGTRRRRRSCAQDGGVVSVQRGCAALAPAPRYCGGAALLTRVAGGPGATRFVRCAGRQTGHDGMHSPCQALVCRIRLLSLAALRRRVPGMISGRAPLAQAASIPCSSTPVSPGYLRHAAPSRAIYRSSTRYTLLFPRWSPSGGAPTPMVLRSAVALLDTFRGGGTCSQASPQKTRPPVAELPRWTRHDQWAKLRGGFRISRARRRAVRAGWSLPEAEAPQEVRKFSSVRLEDFPENLPDPSGKNTSKPISVPSKNCVPFAAQPLLRIFITYLSARAASCFPE